MSSLLLRFPKSLIVLGVATVMAAGPASAAEIVVRLTVPGATTGEVGCTLFAAGGGFPMEASRSLAMQWYPAAETVECRFLDLAPGTYAVAASHDLNGNRRVDTNVFGIPKEAWGVSRNARPALRAPRFDEAQVSVPDAGGRMTVAIEVRR